MNPFGLIVIAIGGYLAYVGATGNSGALKGIVGTSPSTTTKTSTSTAPKGTNTTLPSPGTRRVA